MTTASILNKRD